jgi:hypothetical protein
MRKSADDRVRAIFASNKACENEKHNRLIRAKIVCPQCWIKVIEDVEQLVRKEQEQEYAIDMKSAVKAATIVGKQEAFKEITKWCESLSGE